MLNEYLESKEYTDLENLKSIRLNRKYLLKVKKIGDEPQLAGINRALEIIARKALSDNQNIPSTERVQVVTKALEEYVGKTFPTYLKTFVRQDSEMIPEAIKKLKASSEWLTQESCACVDCYCTEDEGGIKKSESMKNMIQSACENDSALLNFGTDWKDILILEKAFAQEKSRSANKCIKTSDLNPFHTAMTVQRALKKLNRNRSSENGQYLAPLFPEMNPEGKKMRSDYYAVSYDRVITEAFRKGPLKNYCLIVKNKAILNRIRKKKSDSYAPLKNAGKDLDDVLKQIAAHLLEQLQNPGQAYVPHHIADLRNWLLASEPGSYYYAFDLTGEAKNFPYLTCENPEALEKWQYSADLSEGKYRLPIESECIQDQGAVFVPLFDKRTLVNNISKKRLNQITAPDGEPLFQLIEMPKDACGKDSKNLPEIKAYIQKHPKAAIYMDCGSQNLLQEIT